MIYHQLQNLQNLQNLQFSKSLFPKVPETLTSYLINNYAL